MRTLDGAPFETMKIERAPRTRAYVKIEDGCENHCAYCAIPAARGPVRSKRISDALEEIRGLAAGGVREIVLTGIETASFGADTGEKLGDLLYLCDNIESLARIRLGSLEPTLFRPAFIRQISGLKKLAPHFHLSLQSGCSKTLAAMAPEIHRSNGDAGDSKPPCRHSRRSVNRRFHRWLSRRNGDGF